MIIVLSIIFISDHLRSDWNRQSRQMVFAMFYFWKRKKFVSSWTSKGRCWSGGGGVHLLVPQCDTRVCHVIGGQGNKKKQQTTNKQTDNDDDNNERSHRGDGRANWVHFHFIVWHFNCSSYSVRGCVFGRFFFICLFKSRKIFHLPFNLHFIASLVYLCLALFFLFPEKNNLKKKIKKWEEQRRFSVRPVAKFCYLKVSDLSQLAARKWNVQIYRGRKWFWHLGNTNQFSNAFRPDKLRIQWFHFLEKKMKGGGVTVNE